MGALSIWHWFIVMVVLMPGYPLTAPYLAFFLSKMI
jgi:hypothetical protein